MVLTNGPNVSNNVMVDGVSITESTGGLGGSDLRINGPGACSEPSEFEFSQLIIWNQALTSAEMNVVSTALNTYLTSGTLR